jgi:hypothetical protein
MVRIEIKEANKSNARIYKCIRQDRWWEAMAPPSLHCYEQWIYNISGSELRF